MINNFEDCLKSGKIKKFSRGKTLSPKEIRLAEEDLRTAEKSFKDKNGQPLANKNVELSYLRGVDNYIARNTQTTNENGVLVWGMPSIVPGEVVLTAIADGVELTQHPFVLFTYTD